MIARIRFSLTFILSEILALELWAKETLMAVFGNQYLEVINIPNYDSDNPSHCLIPDDEPWSATTINNATFQHFYVRAGNYTGRVIITTSGNDINRRTISPYTDTDIHPGKLSDSSRVKIALHFDNADYWTIDKISSNQEVFNTINQKGVILLDVGSSHNIFNEMYFGEGWQSFEIRNQADSNTIQKCFFDGASASLYASDLSQIQFLHYTNQVMIQTLNNKIILNEFRNMRPMRLQCKDNAEELGYKDFSGTIVDSNVYWCDGDIYCDLDGTPNVNGEYTIAETSWGGIKSASRDANNPVIFSNNAMWGGRSQYTGSGSLSPGFLILYYHTEYIELKNNIVHDCPAGISISSAHGSTEVWNVRVEDNIINGCGFDVTGTEPIRSCSMRIQNTYNFNVQNNLIKNPFQYWGVVQSSTGTNYMGDNDIVNKDGNLYHTGNDVEGLTVNITNTEMTTTEGDILYPYDYTIHYMKYTNNPQTKVIANVLKTVQ